MSSVQVDKKEWEELQEKLSELESKYQSVLHELDTARSRIQALDHPPKPADKKLPDAPTSQRKETRTGLAKRPREESTFLTRLKGELHRLSGHLTKPPNLSPNAPPNYASCSRCGSKIMNASRFCNRCDADFGKWICSCGRELAETVRFCDNCGKRVDLEPVPGV